MNRTRYVSSVTAAATAALVLSGCTAPAATSTGPRTLRVAYFDPDDSYDPALTWFLNALDEESNGRLRVEMSWECCNPGLTTASNELGIIAAVNAGDFDLGVVGVRTLDAVGVTALDGLQAPMQINSYAKQKAVLQDPAVQKAALAIHHVGGDGASVVGLLPGPMRYPISFRTDAPLLGVASWKGAKVWVAANDVQKAAVTAFGAEPKWEGDRDAMLSAGQLDGVENSVLWSADYASDTRAVTTNVALWPKPDAVLLGGKAAKRMTAEERTWIEKAARVTASSADRIADFEETYTTTCSYPIVAASPQDVAGLAAAVGPVHDRLAADKAAAAVLARVDKLAGPPGAATPIDRTC